jgi:hypothetical protein
MRTTIFFLTIHLSSIKVALADDEPPVCAVERYDTCPPADLVLVTTLQKHCFDTFVGMDCTVGVIPAWAYCLSAGINLAETCDDTCVVDELLSIRSCDDLTAYEEAGPPCR